MGNFKQPIKTYDVAVIGAGFSGTMVAVNLARKSKEKARVLLIERVGAPGRGVAYGTTDNQHLLNVRAERMGAFAEDPKGFYNWLQDHPQVVIEAEIRNLALNSFLPRRVYGTYLQDILRQTRQEYACIDILQEDVTDIVPAGAAYEVHTARKLVANATSIVLALGNFPPGNAASDRAINPYAPEIYDRLAEHGDVLLIGTGLTSLDLLATMARTKNYGKIHMMSRGGRLPQIHKDIVPYPAFLEESCLPVTALDLLTKVRKEIRKAAQQGIGWQSVVDALRPLNQTLWRSLPLPEQQKFLRHLRPYWDIHRHRCAPEIMAAYNKLAAARRLVLHRGAFVAMAETDAGVDVTWRPIGSLKTETMVVHYAVNCTGPQSDCRKLNDPLIVNLLKRDLLTPGPLYIGFDVNEEGALKTASGEIVPRLYTLGLWRKGRLYESVAVPELRVQAADLAQTLITAQAN